MTHKRCKDDRYCPDCYPGRLNDRARQKIWELLDEFEFGEYLDPSSSNKTNFFGMRERHAPEMLVRAMEHAQNILYQESLGRAAEVASKEHRKRGGKTMPAKGLVSPVTEKEVIRCMLIRLGQGPWARKIRKEWGITAGMPYDAAHIPGFKSGETGEGTAADGIPILSLHAGVDRWLNGKQSDIRIIVSKEGTPYRQVLGKARKELQAWLAGDPISVPNPHKEGFLKNLAKTKRFKKT
jgi:hypothetical protein